MRNENEHMDEFDRLINKASAMGEFAMREEDWNQLEAMMDAHNRGRLAGWIWRGTVGALMLLLLSIGVGEDPILLNQDWTMGEGMEETNAKVNSEVSEKSGVETSVGVLESNDANRLPSAQGTSLNDSKGEAQALPLEEQQARFIPSVDKQTAGVVQSIQASDQASFTSNGMESTSSNYVDSPVKPEVAFQAPNDVTNEGPVGNNVSPVNDVTGAHIMTEEEEADKPSIPEFLALDTIDIQPLTPQKDSVLSIENESSVFEPMDAADMDSVIARSRRRKLHFYVGGGTDWSKASRMDVGPTKFKLQIGGEYLFLSKLSILSGVNYAVKAYETNSENYTVKQGFWTNGIQPNNIAAKCRVIEVPLNLRYYFAAQDTAQSSFYVMAGASTYLMASERYSFAYEEEDPALKQEWNGEWESFDYFSTLTVSAGYQKQVLPHWSILFEPYINLPLTGIGFGEVDIVSFGLSVQIKH